jgi:hypothetical protein
MNDWRIGRMIAAVSKNWDTPSSTNLVYPANRQRVGLLIGTSIVCSATTGITITFSGGAVIALYAAQPPLRLSLAEHGLLVQQGFTIAVAFGATTGSVTEFIMPENYLSAGLEQFRSEYKMNR